MKAIDFVVRDGAGGVQRGTVSGDDKSHTIQAQAGQEISLNLRQTDLQNQVRSGDDLVITLADGRVITIDNFFNDTGAANRLFVSADGYLNEVSHVELAGGNLHAQYGPTEQWGKWSPSDELIFLERTELAHVGGANGDDEVSMLGLGAALLGGGGLGLGSGAVVAAGAVGGAAILGSLGGGDSDSGINEPFVNNAEDTTDVGGDDTSTHTLTVSGGGEAGDSVDITVGDQTQTVIIGEDGTFEVVFEGDTFPEDGTHETVATVVTGDGEVVLDGPGFVIDTTAPDLTVTQGTESVGDFFNADGYAGGVGISGTGEAGATVDVTVSGVTQSTVVGADGTWSVSWADGELEAGEYTSGVTIVTTDSFGNSATSTDTLIVDTVSEVSINTSTVEIDGVANGAEASDGVQITGTSQAGSSVVVTMGGFSHTVITGGDGTWSVDFAAGEVAPGEYTADITAVATDGYGNTATTSGQIQIDTFVNNLAYTSSTGGTDGVISGSEIGSDMTVTGTTEPGSTLTVTLGGVTHNATVAGDGSWSVTFAAGEIAPGEYTTTMTATATDAAGNVASVDQEVTVDTDAGVLTIDAAPIEVDDVVNLAEQSDGVTITGTSNANATVDVTLGGVTTTVQADGNGVWSADFTAAQVPEGDYTSQISATTSDPFGNSLSASDSVHIDTQVDNLSVSTDTVGGDGTVNAAEHGGAVTVTGTTEVGSTSVVVEMGGASGNATVSANGNWSVTFPAGTLATGTYDADVLVTATDAAGNTDTTSGVVHIDTEVVPFSNTSSAGGSDGVLNAAEAAAGVNLGGQVEAGSTVVVNFDGTNHTATVDGAGNWSLSIPASAITAGTYDADIVITATDHVGNVAVLNDTLAIDTDAPEGPVIAAYTRDGDGFRGIATDPELGSDGQPLSGVTTDVFQVNPDGSTAGVVNNQTFNDFRDETNIDFAVNVPDGSDIVVTNTDDAGNSTGTYLVLDDETVSADVSLDSPALGNLQIEQVDLQFAEEAHLTIDEAALVALSTNSNTLLVHGGSDDNITITGGTQTGTQQVDGNTYDVYSVGEGTVIVDEDINVI